ncbi:MAG: methyltransferase domain-containing protein [Limnohabitans sp.]
MARQIIESPSPIPTWLQSLGEPTAQRLLGWGRMQAAECLADVFGYHALQLGWPGFEALSSNRMPHRWLAQQEFDDNVPSSALLFDSRAWPWAPESLDLVVLPHTLERSADPHACLREVERVLIPEGQVFILGINPWSLWGRQLRRSQARQSGESHWQLQTIAPHRLRDWLHLLGFEVQLQRFAGWTPTWRSERWVQRWSWLDRIGKRWCPILGGAYLMVATKRVHGGRLLDGRAWRTVPSRSVIPAPAASIEAPVRASPNRESPF